MGEAKGHASHGLSVTLELLSTGSPSLLEAGHRKGAWSGTGERAAIPGYSVDREIVSCRGGGGGIRCIDGK